MLKEKSPQLQAPPSPHLQGPLPPPARRHPRANSLPLCSSAPKPDTPSPPTSIHANRCQSPEAGPAKCSTRQPGHPVTCTNHQLRKGWTYWTGGPAGDRGRWPSPPAPIADETAEHLLMGQLPRALILGTHGDQDRKVQQQKAEWRGASGHVQVSQTRVQIWAEPLPLLQVTWGHILWVCFFTCKRGRYWQDNKGG